MAGNTKRSASRVRWPVEMEEKLVELWQQYECLFNVSCKTYYNRTDKERSWAEIATALNLPVEEVKTRATSLRTQYSKLLKPRPGGSEDRTLTSKQRWLSTSLDFLKKHVTQRSAESSLHQSKDVLAAEQDTDDTSSDPDDLSEMSEDATAALSTTGSQPSTWQNNGECLSPTLQPAKKRHKGQTVDPIEKQKLELLQQMSVAMQIRQAAGCDVLFGTQVAEELRLIKNPVIKTRLKRKIMNAVYEAQECDQSGLMPSSSYLPPPIDPPPPPLQVPPPHTPTQSLP